jgi:adenylate kinase family enzyme
MKGLEFPIVGTKVKGLSRKFDLNSPDGRKQYFEAKTGEEIKHLKEFLKENTFIAYILGKKGSGKGTYSKLFAEIFGVDKVKPVSVGDIVREVHATLETPKGRSGIEKYLENNYRGFITPKEGIEAILNRSQDKVSVPNEVMLSLIEREIDKHKGKVLFIDGFPRTLDQVSYSLFFRELMGHRGDPDVFILIDIPESVIDARIKTRVVCPKCNTPRNVKLDPTTKIGYEQEAGDFYLYCDNPDCTGSKMVRKEGDELGIGPIRARLDSDEEILRKAFSLYGVPKVLLRNHVPVAEAEKYFDDYEFTPQYNYFWNKNSKMIKTEKTKWTVLDDCGVESFSLVPSPVVVTMLKQLVEALEI